MSQMSFRQRKRTGWTSLGSKPLTELDSTSNHQPSSESDRAGCFSFCSQYTLLFLQCGGLVAALWSGLKKVVVGNTSAEVCFSSYFSFVHIFVLSAATKCFSSGDKHKLIWSYGPIKKTDKNMKYKRIVNLLDIMQLHQNKCVLGLQ